MPSPPKPIAKAKGNPAAKPAQPAKKPPPPPPPMGVWVRIKLLQNGRPPAQGVFQVDNKATEADVEAPPNRGPKPEVKDDQPGVYLVIARAPGEYTVQVAVGTAFSREVTVEVKRFPVAALPSKDWVLKYGYGDKKLALPNQSFWTYEQWPDLVIRVPDEPQKLVEIESAAEIDLLLKGQKKPAMAPCK